jgi:hypothetical protein
MSKKFEIDAETRQAYLTVLEEIVTEQDYSPYGVVKVVNEILVAAGRDVLRPQMMYNYARNGLLVQGEKIFGASLRKITSQEVMEFIIRYCVRNNVEIKINDKVSSDQMVIDIDELMVTE